MPAGVSGTTRLVETIGGAVDALFRAIGKAARW
jgi:hypothetical protein